MKLGQKPFLAGIDLAKWPGLRAFSERVENRRFR